MEKQIEETMKRAFYDLIEENTNSSTPDYDWIVNLYTEIRLTLLQYLRKDGSTYKSIEESFDVELFSQMIRADVFSAESMIKLIETTFYWIKQLGAPVRDKEIEEAKERVLKSPLNKIISVYLKETHQSLMIYQQDMESFLQNK
jgi:hypothetical protein